MAAFKHVVVPTDFGEPATRSVAFAVALASTFESKVTSLHTGKLAPWAYAADGEVLHWSSDAMARKAMGALNAALSRAGKLSHPKEPSLPRSPWKRSPETSSSPSPSAAEAPPANAATTRRGPSSESENQDAAGDRTRPKGNSSIEARQ